LSFICVLQLDLHLPENHDLKGKRKEAQSLKKLLQTRFGAAVAETANQDKWQRATFTIALVGGDRRQIDGTADALQRFVESRFGEWVRWDRSVHTPDELGEV
jgi:uncharacterized protein YlxP (DUF503 family)